MSDERLDVRHRVLTEEDEPYGPWPTLPDPDGYWAALRDSLRT